MSVTKGVRARVISPLDGAVAGGEVPVEVTGTGTSPSARINDLPAGATFVASAAEGTWRAVRSGLATGDNTITVAAGADTATVQVRSYPVEGPVFGGPHLNPWTATTEENGLDAPLDERGNAPARITYYCKDTVRCDPAGPWTGARPQSGWNGKLCLFYYGGWNQSWSQGSRMDVVLPSAQSFMDYLDPGLRRGFMAGRTTLAQSSTNPDPVRGAESVLVLTEHVTRHYPGGEPLIP